ncbi:MAG: hypothetical protein B6I20_08980 [Bacteroidetes bacterium 4572_117]|nr:MAG: hypothetical protein B6I20_08980 [Bacteroidetes bacterium 4572_117]
MKTHVKLFLLSALLFFITCTDKIVEKPFISPPFAELNPQYADYELDANVGDTVFIDSGTEIIIPANIWVNKMGEKITGKINMKYRELNDASDVFLAGVTLDYDSAGVKNQFKTAGMFELVAFKDTNEIFIDKGNYIDVKFASDVEGGEYNFYTLDEKNKNWAFKGTDQPVFNEKINTMNDSITKLSPKHPFPFTKDYFALDYYSILDVYFNVKPRGNLYPYLKNKSLKRKTKKYGLSWSAIYPGWEHVVFNGRKYYAYELVWKNVSGKKMPRWMQKKEYIRENDLTKITKIGKNKYYMHVVDSEYKPKYNFKFLAEAIMPLKQVFKLMPDDWKNEYKIINEQIAERKRKLEMQKQFLRTYRIDQTGWHNWDVISKRQDKILVKADFKFDKEIDSETLPLMYFTDNNKSYVKIPYSDWDKIMLVPDSTAKFVAVLSDKEAAVFTATDYNAINFNELSKNKEPSYTFNMKTIKINNHDDFLKIMKN